MTMRTVKGIFLDFYGTAVEEDGKQIHDVIQKMICGGAQGGSEEIGMFWYKRFSELTDHAYGNAFMTQRAIELQVISDTLARFGATGDAAALAEILFARWRQAPAFEDTKCFLQQSPAPVYVVSNIDRSDVEAAIRFNKLSVAGVFTSEDARSYKPRSELFELALRETRLEPAEVVHIGDSLKSDIGGAGALNIRTVWINREGEPAPEDVVSVSTLTEVLKLEYFQ